MRIFLSSAKLFIAAIVAASAADPIEVALDKSGTYHRYAEFTATDHSRGSGGVGAPRWHAHEGFERLVFGFEENVHVAEPEKAAPALDAVPLFSARHEGVPERIVVDYASRSGARFKLVPFEGKGSKLVRRVYKLPVLDDASASFAIEFQKEVEVEIFVLAKPGRLVVDARPVAEPDERPVFAARTRSYPLGAVERVGHLAERLGAAGNGLPRKLLTADGEAWCLQVGHSARDWKADIHASGFGEPLDGQLLVEARPNGCAAPLREFEPHISKQVEEMKIDQSKAQDK